jgi:hypothetical protein
MKVPTLLSFNIGKRSSRGGGVDGDSGDAHDLEVNLTNSTPFLLSFLQIIGTVARGENKVRGG